MMMLLNCTAAAAAVAAIVTSAAVVVVLLLLTTTVLSQWDFSYGKLGLSSLGKASYDKVALPNLRCLLGVLVFL